MRRFFLLLFLLLLAANPLPAVTAVSAGDAATADGEWSWPALRAGGTYTFSLSGSFGGGTATLGYIDAAGSFASLGRSLTAAGSYTAVLPESATAGFGTPAVSLSGATTPALVLTTTKSDAGTAEVTNAAVVSAIEADPTAVRTASASMAAGTEDTGMVMADDFTGKTGALHGQNAATGQTWTVDDDTSGTEECSADGWTIDYNDNADANYEDKAYAIMTLAAPVRRWGMLIRGEQFLDGNINPQVVLLATEAPPSNNNSIHVVLSNSTLSIQTGSPGSFTTLDSVSTGVLAGVAGYGGVCVFEVEVVGTTITARVGNPDNPVELSATDASVGTYHSENIVYEHYCGRTASSNTANRKYTFIKAWATNTAYSDFKSTLAAVSYEVGTDNERDAETLIGNTVPSWGGHLLGSYSRGDFFNRGGLDEVVLTDQSNEYESNLRQVFPAIVNQSSFMWTQDTAGSNLKNLVVNMQNGSLRFQFRNDADTADATRLLDISTSDSNGEILTSQVGAWSGRAIVGSSGVSHSYSGGQHNFTLTDYGKAKLVEQSSDPADPSEGQAILWQSDGTGFGDDGDIVIKVTAGGTTKTVTLVDFSAATDEEP